MQLQQALILLLAAFFVCCHAYRRPAGEQQLSTRVVFTDLHGGLSKTNCFQAARFLMSLVYAV